MSNRTPSALFGGGKSSHHHQNLFIPVPILNEKGEKLSLEQRIQKIENALGRNLFRNLSIKDAFEYSDQDGVPGLSYAEFRKLLEKCHINVSDEEFKALMERYDDDEIIMMMAVIYVYDYACVCPPPISTRVLRIG